MTIKVKQITSEYPVPVFISGEGALIVLLRDLYGEAEHEDEVIGLPRGKGDPDSFGYPGEATDE